MAGISAAINLVISGGSKIDQVIDKANRLESIVNNINKTPLEVNVDKTKSSFDKIDSELKAARTTLSNLQTTYDRSAKSINDYAGEILDLQKKLGTLTPNTQKYNAVLEKQNKVIRERAAAQNLAANALVKISKQESKIEGLEKGVNVSAAAKKASIALETLAGNYLRLGKAQNTASDRSTISSLAAQAEALKLVANNSEIASSQFNRYSIAAQAASQKIFQARQKQLDALAFGLSPEAPKVNLGRGGAGSIAGARNLVGAFVESYGAITKSRVALTEYISQASNLQSVVPFDSSEWNLLETVINDVNGELQQLEQRFKGLRGQSSNLAQAVADGIAPGIAAPRGRGPSQLLPQFDIKSAADKAKYYSGIEDQVSRLAGFEERIAQANLTQVQKVELRSRLDRALSLLAENRLEDAKRETVEIERQRMSLERMNRAGSEKPQGLAVELGGGAELRERNKYEAEQVRLRGQIAEATNTAAAAVQRLEAAQGRISMVQQFEEIQSGIKSVSDEVDAFLRKDKQALSEFDKKLKETSTVIKQVKQGVAVDLGGGAEVRERAKFEESTEKNLRRRNSILASGAIIEQGLYNLRSKGVNVDQTLEGLQRSLNAAKLEEFEITSRTLDALSEQVSLAGKYAQLQRTALAGQPGTGGKKAGPEGTGLEAALKKLEEARAARQKFLGSASPAQAIDQIVREFNKGKPGGGAGANVVNTLLSEASAGVPKAAVAGEQLGKAVEEGLNDGLGIQSPSKVAIEAMLNVINTLVSTAKSGKAKVQAALEDLVAPKLGSVQKSPLLKSLTATTEDTIEKLSNFIGRASAKPSLYRPLARLAGPELLSGGAVPQAMQRKAFEAGKILPETRLLPLSERRLLRGSANAPGGGLESEVLRAAIKGVSGTGAFVGPLASSVRGQGAVASRLFPALSQGPAGLGGTGIFPVRPQPRVGAPGSAFPFQSYRMSGAQQFPADEAINLLQKSATRGDANRALADAISRYRDAVNNFWEGEDSQFEAISKVVKSSVQVGGAKLARKFTESGRGAGLSEIADVVSGEKELGVSRFVGQSTQRISDSILNSIEPLAYSIGDSFKDGIDKIRNAVPGLVSRGLSVASGAIGGGGGRPPLPPGGGGGQARDPGEFGRRLSQAADQGADAILGLRELRDPSKATTVELEALSAVLKEFRNILDPTVEGFDRLEKQLRESAAGIDRQLERRDPDADFLTRRFGPRGGRAVSEGLVGGAFPLLFGQGVGAAVGGGLGGAAGGFAGGGLGFGLSLVGTALGTALDTLSQAAQDTGKALNYPIEGFEKLKEAGLLAGRQQEYYISKLIEAGRATEAAGLIQAEIIKKIGTQGVSDLRELGDSSTKLSRAWAEFNLQLQAALAGPMAGLLKWLAGVIEAGNSVGREAARQTDILAGLSSGDKERLLSEQSKLLGKANFFNEPQINKQISELYTRFAPLAKQPAMGGQLTPEQQEQALSKSIEAAEKIRSLRQQGIDVERSAQDLRLSIEDTIYGFRRRAADMEREAIEFRRSVEDQIFSKRQELEQKLIENDRKRQQNAIDAFDLQLQQAATGLDPVAQGIVNAAREYLRVRAEGEANLQQNERQLKLQLQQIDQEVNRYKLQVEDRISQMAIQREEFARDVSKAKLQIERQIGDYAVKVEEYRLEMARRRYDLAVEEGNLLKAAQIARTEGLGVPATGKNYANVGGYQNGRQMLHGIPGFVGNDPSHATPENIHYHFAGKNPAETKAVAEYLKGLGYQITEFSGFGQRVGRHSPGSQHYVGNAFDIPGASMEGRGGMADIVAGQKRVHALILDFLGAKGQQTPAARASSNAGKATPVAPAAPSMPELPSAPQMVSINDLMAKYLDLQTQIKNAVQANNQEESRRLALQSQSARLAFEQQTLSPIRQYQEQNRELQFEIEKRQLRNRLLMEGVKPEIVDGELRVLEINRTLNSVLEGLEVSTNEQVKAELERLKLNPKLVDASFRLTEATLAGLVATAQDIKTQEELRKKLQEILNLKNQLGTGAQGEAAGAVAGARAIGLQNADPSEKMRETMGQMRMEFEELVSMANQAKFAAETFGGAFANGITQAASAISGLGNFSERLDLSTEISQLERLRSKVEEGSDEYKDYTNQINRAKSELSQMSNVGLQVQSALAQMMQGIADAFAEMAAEIIAKQTIMIIYGAIMKALGIAGSFGGASAAPGGIPSTGNVTGPSVNGFDTGSIANLAAKGAYFDGKTSSFANGGMFTNSIVSSPTLFKFADGGLAKSGLMGEAGPEAIMPLTRGPDGRLGVDANGLSDAIAEARGALDEAGLNLDGQDGEEMQGSNSDQNTFNNSDRKAAAATDSVKELSYVLQDSRGAIEDMKRISRDREASAAAIAASPDAKELYKLLAPMGKETSTIRELLGSASGSDSSSAAGVVGPNAPQGDQSDAILAARNAIADGIEINGGQADGAAANAITNSRELIERIKSTEKAQLAAQSQEGKSAIDSARAAVATDKSTAEYFNAKESSALMQARETTDSMMALTQTRQMLNSVATVNKERSVERAIEATASGPVKPIDVRYESQVINSVEYVTAEQHRKGINEAAERGRSLTLSSLKNSVKARRQIGM